MCIDIMDMMILCALLQFTHPMAVEIALKVADAVNYMHSHNPKSSIKMPQNVLVSYDAVMLDYFSEVPIFA